MAWFDYFTTPTSYRTHLQDLANVAARGHSVLVNNPATFEILEDVQTASSRPDFGNLTLLVFEAVLEVVCVALPGYIVARQGMFDAEAQKFVANLNVMLFTPCMIFTKLASQLTAEKIQELAIIPVIFIVLTAVTFTSAWTVSYILRLKKRQRSFVIAMGVFGNSNSLPISLVLSLSKTLSGLHWDKVPNDNDEEVGARGILYLLIFQQLGQLLRWTWGYNVLLAPADRFTEEEGGTAHLVNMERGRGEHRDVDSDSQRLLSPSDSHGYASSFDDERTRVDDSTVTSGRGKSPDDLNDRGSQDSFSNSTPTLTTPLRGNSAPNSQELHKGHERLHNEHKSGRFKSFLTKTKNFFTASARQIRKMGKAIFGALPNVISKPLAFTWRIVSRFCKGLWAFMNPPLWAMLIAIVVATIPSLQSLFFDEGTFIKNSVTSAIKQNGNVAVPLILVVLGGNLARNTITKSDRPGEEADASEERKLLIASLVSRMLVPTIIMTPLLALTAKYVPISILDDKIFIIVCFLLIGAPSALQLAQICQLNNVYMTVMSKILFQSYVIWILPSTLVLVLLALETVSWAETK